MSRRFAFYSPGAPNGQYTFSGIYSNFGLADFLFGNPINSRLDVTKFFNLHRFYFSWFVQDNWRVTSKLSINMGLRNDSITAWKERHNRLAGFVPDNGGTLVPVGTAPFTGDSVLQGRPWQLGSSSRLRLHADAEDRDPCRWRHLLQLQERDLRQLAGEECALQRNARHRERCRTTSPQRMPISAGFPAERPELWPIAGTGFLLLAGRQQDVHDVRVELQRAAGTARQHGADGRLCRRQGDLCRCCRTEYQSGHPRSGTGCEPAAISEPQLTPPVSFRGATPPTTRCRPHSTGAWEQSDSPAPGHGRTASTTPAANRATPRFRTHATWRRSRQVRPSISVTSWRLSGTYETAVRQGKTMDELRSRGRSTGLSVAGRSTTSSRCKADCHSRRSMQTSTLNTGTGSQFPNRIASGELPSSERTIDRWFDVSAFTAPAQFTFGNSGRNILRGPGTKQIDLSLFKSFPFRSAARRVSGRGVQRPEHAAVQQSECEHRIQRGRAHHQRGKPDGVSAHVAANSTGAEAVFLANDVVRRRRLRRRSASAGRLRRSWLCTAIPVTASRAASARVRITN